MLVTSKEDLSFVPSLGTSYEQHPIAANVAPGTHTDCILKESARPFDAYGEPDARVADMAQFVLATSFPDILPPNGKALLDKSWAIFTRGEFFALRALGDGVYDVPLDLGLHFRSKQVVRWIMNAAPGVIYHRLMDYNPDEFGFLSAHNRFAKVRGSRRLLDDECLLEHELGVVKQMMGSGKDVRVILPYVTNPDEQAEIQAIVQQETSPNQIGTMVERVEHAHNIADYPPVHFVFPGPSDLTSDLKNESRGAYRYGDSTEQAIIDLSRDMARSAAAIGIRDVLAIKILVGQIEPTGNQRIHDVYMPNQLLVNRGTN
ncbi:MAG TPA: hypothetical protein VLG47_03625 [Candidatus Saccharimonadales bacterium]|nr:hypothetical protein [Candidatus Saccharimonadales bacterium]